jgi:hypothetical protein
MTVLLGFACLLLLGLVFSRLRARKGGKPQIPRLFH